MTQSVTTTLKIDFDLLNNQREKLNEVINSGNLTSEQEEALTGLQNLLDDVSDLNPMIKYYEKRTEQAFSFLCDRQPSNFDMHRSSYVGLLMDFQDTHGDTAIEALAGFYLFAIRNLKDEKQHHAIASTFAHDLGKDCRTDKMALPRSSEYAHIWSDEFAKYNDHKITTESATNQQ